MVNCLARMSRESAGGVPVWPLQGIETFCMTGFHSVTVAAEAYGKGFAGLNLRDFYPGMRKRVFEDDYRGHDVYRRLGFLPADAQRESVSYGLDFVYEDWAVAVVARALGEHADADKLMARAGKYRNFYDSRVGYMRPRLADGTFPEPFSPAETRYSARWADLTESNPWQTMFAVQHDPHGLAALIGGEKAMERKLDELFEADPTLPERAAVDIAGMVEQYAHGNEVSHHIPYLYSFAEYRTRRRSAWPACWRPDTTTFPMGWRATKTAGRWRLGTA